jgi:hypothetical protein
MEMDSPINSFKRFAQLARLPRAYFLFVIGIITRHHTHWGQSQTGRRESAAEFTFNNVCGWWIVDRIPSSTAAVSVSCIL